MDHRLVEFAARLPTRLKVRGRTLRYAQQQLAKRYLPREVLARKKQGFASALPYLVAREWPALHDVFLDNMCLVRDGWLEEAGVRNLWREHCAGRHHANRLWLLINAEAWYRTSVLQHDAADLTAELRERRRPRGTHVKQDVIPRDTGIPAGAQPAQTRMSVSTPSSTKAA